MDDNIKTFIKTNAFLGYNILIDQNMGSFKCPKIDDLKENLLTYIYFVNRFIDLYEDNKNNFYISILSDQKQLEDFASMVCLFFEVNEIKLRDYKLIIKEQEFLDKDKKLIVIENFIDESNISIFMETLRILHHFDKKDDDYLPLNKIAAEMIARARKLKKEMQAKIKQQDGVGFLEIMSTVSARHASINPTNIGQLSYFQILDQYKRLMMIDLWTPCLYGNASDEYIKKNNVKHYSLKLINE